MLESARTWMEDTFRSFNPAPPPGAAPAPAAAGVDASVIRVNYTKVDSKGEEQLQLDTIMCTLSRGRNRTELANASCFSRSLAPWPAPASFAFGLSLRWDLAGAATTSSFLSRASLTCTGLDRVGASGVVGF